MIDLYMGVWVMCYIVYMLGSGVQILLGRVTVVLVIVVMWLLLIVDTDQGLALQVLTLPQLSSSCLNFPHYCC